MSTTFAQLGVPEAICRALASRGIVDAFEIQAATIADALDGRDVSGRAPTGSGKTLAFGIPLVATVERAEKRRPRGLILAPTRELADQITTELRSFAGGVRVAAVYGGVGYGPQLKALNTGVDVLVACPGRLEDLIERGSVSLDRVDKVVLDEADRMADMGFMPAVKRILDQTADRRQTVLFSATMPPRVNSIARSHLNDPEIVKIAKPQDDPDSMPQVTQTVYTVTRHHKAAALGRILDMEAPEAAIVFCKTRVIVDQLAETLNGRGYRAEALHGGMSQEQRDRALGKLKNSVSNLLLATDVAARGLDISHLTHVVNFDVPTEPEAYVHRIGRVGRAGRQGVAITLSEPREQRLIKNIERVVKQKLTPADIPSADDLRSRRMAITEKAVLEALDSEANADYRAMAEKLKDENDLNSFDLAAAALRLLHEATAPESDNSEIPTAKFRERPDYKDGNRKGNFKKDRPQRRNSRDEGDRTRLYVSGGKNTGMRPTDLVGAIAGEAGVPGSQIGPIEIKEKFSLVSVPADEAEKVLSAMKGVNIRGKRLTFRREKF